jgi:hypothetical protein
VAAVTVDWHVSAADADRMRADEAVTAEVTERLAVRACFRTGPAVAEQVAAIGADTVLTLVALAVVDDVADSDAARVCTTALDCVSANRSHAGVIARSP